MKIMRCSVPFVRLLDEGQNMIGVVPTSDALQRARDADLDLVTISPDADPPVVRIMDYSKYRYELQKKKREAQKKAAANRQVLKELKMRYNIDTHDYAVRQRAAQRFLKDGDKVKVVCQFKGREMDFKDLAVKLFQRFQDELGVMAIVETKISLEGKTMFMVLAPNKAAIEKEKAAAAQSQASKAKTKAGEKSETIETSETPAVKEPAQTLETQASV
jgi:translation initiation factor IF-3